MITGAHHKVSCHCGIATTSRQTLVESTIKRLQACFELAPDGQPWIAHILDDDPELRARLKKALKL